MIFYRSIRNDIEIFTGENEYIRFEIVPAAGGKMISIFNKKLQKEFLWTNKNIKPEIHSPGSDYDTNFWGGIDELIPNDIPEVIDAVSYPDHGELWTTRLDHELTDDSISVYGKLKRSGLYYQKTVRFETDGPVICLDYIIRNESGISRNFLWKLHAALQIEANDQLQTSAKRAQVVDPGYSRFHDLNEFTWPTIEHTDASIIPCKNGTTDFFYLYDIDQAEMCLKTGNGKQVFSYTYDKKVFPFQWYFASYGGFLDHYMVILEPCTGMPMSVNEAIKKKQCARLKPGEELHTTVRIYAGMKR
jgi:hypothetical protein